MPVNGINDGSAPENYTDNLVSQILEAEELERQHKADLDQSIIDTAQILAEMQEQMEQMQEGQNEQDHKSKVRFIIGTVLAVVAAAAAIVSAVVSVLSVIATCA